MEHRVAVRAHRHQVGLWIETILLPPHTKWFDVMHMDEAFADIAVAILEPQMARLTLPSMLS